MLDRYILLRFRFRLTLKQTVSDVRLRVFDNGFFGVAMVYKVPEQCIISYFGVGVGVGVQYMIMVLWGYFKVCWIGIFCQDLGLGQHQNKPYLTFVQGYSIMGSLGQRWFTKFFITLGGGVKGKVTVQDTGRSRILRGRDDTGMQAQQGKQPQSLQMCIRKVLRSYFCYNLSIQSQRKRKVLAVYYKTNLKMLTRQLTAVNVFDLKCMQYVCMYVYMHSYLLRFIFVYIYVQAHICMLFIIRIYSATTCLNCFDGIVFARIFSRIISTLMSFQYKNWIDRSFQMLYFSSTSIQYQCRSFVLAEL
eukprot:TRINITY_DN3296_c0_g1_i7.p2 TRINITY_DN3296_c0_g1~~TRINITY_DN3296_c0_g1_i7.p2  ORF type:complete len:324 (-),score=-4.65 TRINITY_DN3296_c0_g1_i7:279-1190(-)